MTDKERKNKRQRDYRKRTKNSCTNKYEKTPRGFLMRKYRNMQSRVTGIQKLKAHLYKGKSLLNREDFYMWAFNSDDFNNLYTDWVESGYNRKLCPTVDRIDSKYGYFLENMRWITHSENSSLGATSKSRKTFKN
jgi:hypothetical protein